MNSSVATIRELSVEETALVSGAWTWTQLGIAMGSGAFAGAMGGSITGAGIPAGALAGALIGGATYLVNDFLNFCF